MQELEVSQRLQPLVLGVRVDYEPFKLRQSREVDGRALPRQTKPAQICLCVDPVDIGQLDIVKLKALKASLVFQDTDIDRLL